MGAEISLQRMPTKGDIQNKTETTFFLMNRILDFILRNADITDMMSLATDEGCKKWIIIAESNLTNLFNRIRIQPELGKDGILYLKQISLIEKESKKQGLNKQYCDILSFFFIRLFQVVGALSLSVLDTNLPSQDYSFGKKEAQYERKGVPFFKPVVDKKSFYSRIFGPKTGGALTGQDEIVGKYAFLNNYLALTNTANQYQLNTFSKSNEKSRPLPVYVSRNDDGKFEFEFNVTSTTIKFILELDDEIKNMYLKNIRFNNSNTSIKFSDTFSFKYDTRQAFITPRSIDFASYIMNKIEEIRELPKSQAVSILKVLKYLTREEGEFIKLGDTDIFLFKSTQADDNPLFLFTKDSKVDTKKKIRFQFKINLRIEDDSYVLNIGEITIVENNIYVDTSLELDEVKFNIDKKDPYSKIEPLFNKQTIPKYLNNQFMKLYERAEESLEYGIKKGKEGYVRPISDNKIKENLFKYTELWQRLSSDKPVKSFCVARALQLLNLTGLDRVAPKSIKPMVFNTKFPLVIDKSLPSPGSLIISSPSIKSLHTLYDVSFNILKMSSSDIETRQLKLNELLKAFNSEGKPFEEVFELDNSLSETEYRDPKLISQLRTVAIKLFQTQFEHSKKVERLLKKIFIIDNTISLNPSILDKGIKGIEEVAVEARNILTDYYSNCQNDYMAGVSLLRNPTAAPINRGTNKKPTNLNNNNNNNNI